MTGPRLSIIPARAATDRALKPRDLQVLCVLGRHTDDYGWCRRSQVKMADEMGCARSTVFDAIERLVKAGYLERHEQEHESGRDSAHVYRVILDPVHPAVASVPEAACDRDSAADTPCRQVGTPADISAPPAGPVSAPPAGPGPAPINDPSLTTPAERFERERGREEDSKAVERDFKRAYAAWPTFVSDSEPAARKAWGQLTPDERAEAADRQADYVAEVKKLGRQNLCAFAVYLGERRWTKLGPKAAKPEAAAAPDDYAPPFGPVWGAWRISHVLTVDALDMPTPVGRWPMLDALHRKAVLRQGHRFGDRAHKLAPLMEPVPVGSERFEEWRLEHELKGWPWIPDPGGMRVVYFPVGGPGALKDFETAVRGG